MAASEEMGECNAALHQRHERIEGAQAHGAGQMLNRTIRIAPLKDPHVPASEPRDCQIRIERECPVGKRNGVTKLPDEKAQRTSAKRERDRIVCAERGRAPGVSHRLGNFLIVVAHPPIHLPIDIALRCQTVWREQIRDQARSPAPAIAAPRLFPLGSFDGARQAAQIVVVGIEAIGRLAPARSISACSSFGTIVPTTLAAI